MVPYSGSCWTPPMIKNDPWETWLNGNWEKLSAHGWSVFISRSLLLFIDQLSGWIWQLKKTKTSVSIEISIVELFIGRGLLANGLKLDGMRKARGTMPGYSKRRPGATKNVPGQQTKSSNRGWVITWHSPISVESTMAALMPELRRMSGGSVRPSHRYARL